jgi:16S rRNA G966 N2-methylase RsmD
MWSYYGSKSKIVDYYPAPVYDTVIEPFAGASKYALKHWEKNVILVDKYEVIVGLWKWLQKATEKDILGLPDIKEGENVESFNLSQEEKWLIGFFINGGSAQPKKTAKKFNTWNESKSRVAANLHKIRHWDIRLGSYWDIPNQDATWFIDPPYQYGGEWYVKSNKHLNFYDLSVWCKSRQGQVLVCENTKADWLPFVPMKSMQGMKYKTVEAIWSNLPTVYDNIQTKLIA